MSAARGSMNAFDLVARLDFPVTFLQGLTGLESRFSIETKQTFQHRQSSCIGKQSYRNHPEILTAVVG